MKRLALVAFATMSALAFAGNPVAAALFQGSSLAAFGTPSPSAPPVVFSIANGDPTSTFTMGDGAPFSSPPNQLDLTGKSFDVDPEVQFALLDATYFNGITAIGSTVDSVPVTVSLSFTSPFAGTEDFSFSFDFEITPNTTGDPVLDADILTPVNVFASESFTVGTETYTLKLLGFSTDGGVTITPEFVLPELDSVDATLYAKLTTEVAPVPEPLSLVLWGLGAALVGVRRLRKVAV